MAVPVINGYPISAKTMARGYRLTQSRCLLTPDYNYSLAGLNPDTFDWGSQADAALLVAMVEERCLAATGTSPGLAAPSVGGGASVASSWAAMQNALVNSLTYVVKNPDFIDTGAPIYIWGGPEAFQDYCNHHGIGSAGSWGWSYSRDMTNYNPIPTSADSSRTCTSGDRWGMKLMVSELKTFMAGMAAIDLDVTWEEVLNTGHEGDANDFITFGGDESELSAMSATVIGTITTSDANLAYSDGPWATILQKASIYVTEAEPGVQVSYDCKSGGAKANFTLPVAGNAKVWGATAHPDLTGIGGDVTWSYTTFDNIDIAYNKTGVLHEGDYNAEEVTTAHIGGDDFDTDVPTGDFTAVPAPSTNINAGANLNLVLGTGGKGGAYGGITGPMYKGASHMTSYPLTPATPTDFNVSVAVDDMVSTLQLGSYDISSSAHPVTYSTDPLADDITADSSQTTIAGHSYYNTPVDAGSVTSPTTQAIYFEGKDYEFTADDTETGTLRLGGRITTVT